MMEAGELAEAAAIILGFHAPSLTATGGTSPDGGGPPPAGQDEAHIIWAALGPASEPLLYEAVQAVAQEPGEATMGALRARLAELFVGNPDLAQRIEALIAQSGYASLVGQDAHDAFFASATDDFQQLARLRRAFMISFVGAALLSGGVYAILDISFIWIGLFFIVQGMRASIAWYYGQRLRLPGASWLGMATFIPGSFWPVFFTIRGWRPVTLSTAAPAGGRLEVWVKGWMTAYASLSLIALIFMLLSNAAYLFKFLISPFGVFLLLVWLVLYVPGVLLLRHWYWKGRGHNGWQFALMTAMLGMGNVVGAFIGLIGPTLLMSFETLR
jgi:hypothetical protein